MATWKKASRRCWPAAPPDAVLFARASTAARAAQQARQCLQRFEFRLCTEAGAIPILHLLFLHLRIGGMPKRADAVRRCRSLRILVRLPMAEHFQVVLN